MATSKKPTAAKKKPAPKPAPAKKPVAATKSAPAKPVPAKAAPAAAPAKPSAKIPMSAADLKRKLLERKSNGPAKAIAFSLDEVREIAKKNEKQLETSTKTGKTATTTKSAKTHDLTQLE